MGIFSSSNDFANIGQMATSFYTTFDTEILGDPRTPDSCRTPFEQDRDRILHTSAFRRLQAKTQVFKPGEYDFYRTRLTHSLEVAQIGRAVCGYLTQTSPLLRADFCVDQDLVEACCLAHDIGHPPFGHAGEAALNRLMRRYGGFEGNAQTLRLVTKTIFADEGQRRGMSPTRAFLDGILKYKQLWNGDSPPAREFLYRDQKPVLTFVNPSFGNSDTRHMRSIECQIMEWADDTAYCIGDIVDGVRGRFITTESLARWRDEHEELSRNGERWLVALTDAIKTRSIGRFNATQIGEFIRAVSLYEEPTVMDNVTNRYRFRLRVDQDRRRQYTLYKQIAKDLVFRTPQVQQLEAKADMMLRRLFSTFRKHYWGTGTDKTALRLLPAERTPVLWKFLEPTRSLEHGWFVITSLACRMILRFAHIGDYLRRNRDQWLI